MFEYTKNNHLHGARFEENSEAYKWVGSRGQISYQPGTFKEECIKSAQYIWNIAKNLSSPFNQLYLFYSGGIDSEVMVQSFMEADVPFKILSVRYNDNLNSHDLEWVEKFTTANNLDITYFDIDIRKFLSPIGQISYYDKHCKNGLILVQAIMYAADQLQGTPVLTHNEIRVRTLNDKWYYPETERDIVLGDYYESTGRPGIIEFLKYSPEQILSYLESPLVKEFTSLDPIEASKNTNYWPKHRKDQASSLAIKHDIYAQWFDLERRPSYNGGEQFIQPPNEGESPSSMFKQAMEYYQSHMEYNHATFMLYDDIIQYLKGEISDVDYIGTVNW